MPNQTKGDAYINVKNINGGTVIGLNIEAVRRRIPKRSISFGSTLGIIRKAKCTADAGAGLTITADLFDYNTGELQTTGNEVGVIINCRISGGSNLNEATPRIEEDDVIFVSKNNSWNGTETEALWDCVTVFQGTEDCTCEAPA